MTGFFRNPLGVAVLVFFLVFMIASRLGGGRHFLGFAALIGLAIGAIAFFIVRAQNRQA